VACGSSGRVQADRNDVMMASYLHSVGMMHRAMTSLVCVAAFCGSVTFADEEEGLSGTLQLDRESVAVVVGLNRGDGVLRYGGEDIPISVGGVSFPEVGATRGTASGKVYDLDRIDDFDGTYAGTGAGLTLAGGGSAVALKNDKGVTVVFLSANQGLDAELGGTGVRLEIDRPAWAAQRAERAASKAEDAAGSAESAAARAETATQRIATALARSTRGKAEPRESPTAGFGASEPE
jgi:hypothetical protein